ncbi:hypothetical protein, partial [Streptomyces decoyicus]|uniref:hypothetical protein n=1 Tax=Streptomyces decoyicus TaxID=249567 RepID=UPI003F4B80BC
MSDVDGAQAEVLRTAQVPDVGGNRQESLGGRPEAVGAVAPPPIPCGAPGPAVVDSYTSRLLKGYSLAGSAPGR